MSNEIPNANEDKSEEVLELEEETTEEPEEEEKPKEKKQFTPEEQLAIHRREAKKLEKKLGLNSEDKSETKEKATKSSEKSELDYGQLAFYNTKSDIVKIESEEDIEFLKETMADTGKSQQAILGSKWFQNELKEKAEERASKNAVPKGNKRSTSSSKDSVDYWIAKGELPENTPENQELRRKVVNERYKRETNTNKFAPRTTGSIVRQSQLKK